MCDTVSNSPDPECIALQMNKTSYIYIYIYWKMCPFMLCCYALSGTIIYTRHSDNLISQRMVSLYVSTYVRMDL